MDEPRPGVAFVAHCLLNQNSKVGDGAHCAGIYSPVVNVLREAGWRIEQMPCPELAFTGLNRFWAVREQLDTTAYRKHCRRLAATVADMIAMRAARGEDIVLIGVEGSPTMGVHITSSDPTRGGLPEWPEGTSELTSGEGIFIEELHAELGRRGIAVGLGGETHALPEHSEPTQRTQLELLLLNPTPNNSHLNNPTHQNPNPKHPGPGERQRAAERSEGPRPGPGGSGGIASPQPGGHRGVVPWREQ